MPTYGGMHARRRAMLDAADRASELKVRRHGSPAGYALKDAEGIWSCFTHGGELIGYRRRTDDAERLIVDRAIRDRRTTTTPRRTTRS